MNILSRPGGLVKSADRTLEILEFCGRQRHPVAHAEIAGTLGIPKSSVSALLGNMVERDYLTLLPDSNGYSLGVAFPRSSGQRRCSASPLAPSPKPGLSVRSSS